MSLDNISSIKYRLLSFEELVINLDRLSRFKLPEDSFKRVFVYIILKCVTNRNFSKKSVENLSPVEISKIVSKIWNDSVEKYSDNYKDNKIAYNALKYLIKRTFKNTDKSTKILINTNLNISYILSKIDFDSAPVNLKFLIKVNKHIKKKEDLTLDNITKLREKYSLQFPVEKLLIVEGKTEEILLPAFAKKLKLSFDKKGVCVYGAGGKSKSPSLYINLKNRVKIPIILLFDSDAIEICNILISNKEKKDKILIIKKGEFEDILSVNLIKRAFNNEYLMAQPICKKELNSQTKMCDTINKIYKQHNLGEFKKSKFSKIIALNIKYSSDITEEIKKIIYKVI